MTYDIVKYDTNQALPKKLRKIAILKGELYDDIDDITYKFMEANPQIQVPEQRNAVASDTTEHLDGKVINRLIAFREAKLRKLIPYALADMEDYFADDVLGLDDDKFHFLLNVEQEFNDNLLQPLAEYFHRFIVWGALYDWYGQMGMMGQASFYKSELDDIEAEITNSLRTPSITKRPMQPFGPARRPF